LILEDRLAGKIKWDPQDLSDLVVVYRELGSRVVHRQNDVESRLSSRRWWLLALARLSYLTMTYLFSSYSMAGVVLALGIGEWQ
jgi:hypothetical protein